MGWVVTRDHLDEKDIEVIGPRNIKPENVELLKSGKGIPFKMFDDDGELYYTGRMTSVSFDPLDHYGAPNAGCTRLDYCENGKWETL